MVNIVRVVGIDSSSSGPTVLGPKHDSCRRVLLLGCHNGAGAKSG